LVPGLHFIGEVLDVTGWLGGDSFQWAWACGHAAGQAVSPAGPPLMEPAMSIAPLRILSAALLGAALVVGCADPGPPPGGSVAELERIDTQPGEGEIAQAGDEVTVHYTGWVYDEREPDLHGEQFDSSRERDEPFTFPLGAGQVIP